jgi:hypothetical protein
MKWFGYGNRDLAAVERNGEGNNMNSTMIPSVEVGTPRRHEAREMVAGSERAPESGLYLDYTVPACRQEGRAAGCVCYWDGQWREHPSVPSGTKYTVLCSTMNRPWQRHESSGPRLNVDGKEVRCISSNRDKRTWGESAGSQKCRDDLATVMHHLLLEKIRLRSVTVRKKKQTTGYKHQPSHLFTDAKRAFERKFPLSKTQKQPLAKKQRCNASTHRKGASSIITPKVQAIRNPSPGTHHQSFSNSSHHP